MADRENAHVTFLNEAARYFEARPTKGEDAAHWANVYNAENCRKIAGRLVALEEALCTAYVAMRLAKALPGVHAEYDFGPALEEAGAALGYTGCACNG